MLGKPKSASRQRHDFTHRLTATLPTTRDFFRILRTGGFKGRHEPGKDAHLVPRHRAKLPHLSHGEASLTWIGHATYLVRMGGLAILTDPVLSSKIPGRIKRLHPPGLPEEGLPKIDAVVVSHNHYDHLDHATIKGLPRDTACFVPLGLGHWFRKRGFTEVHELDWWASVEHKGVRFELVPAHHWTRRGLFDTNRTLWGGWVISMPAGPKVHFAGDTAYGHWFKEIGERHPGIDVSIMPIGAYEPRWFMHNVHMDPDEAVQAAVDMRARHMATMHWGTFVLTREPLMEPHERVKTAWERTGRPRGELWDLALGETRVVQASAKVAATKPRKAAKRAA